MWLAAAAGVAHAQARDTEAALFDALLGISVEGLGDPQLAAVTELAHRVPVEDPLGPRALYWLSEASAERGDLEAARTTLLEGIRTGQCPDCRAQFQALEIERLAARRGTVWGFDGPHHGVFHPSEVQGYGSIRLMDGAGRSVLEWVTQERPDVVDQLVIGLGEGGAETVTLDLRAVGHAASLEVVVEDTVGRRFTTERPLPVPTEDWTTLVLALGDLTPTDGGPALYPEAARRLSLLGGSHTPTERVGGVSTFWFDRLAVE